MDKNKIPAVSIDNQKIEAFAGQVIADLSAGMSGVLVQLGHELGLYKALGELGPATAPELATKTGTFTRYVAEWLNNQAAGGYITYDAENRTYSLPPEHAIVLAEEDSPAYMAPGFQVVSSLWHDKDRLMRDFREGKGIGWHEHHHNLFFGTEAFFRTGYRAHLTNDWIPSLDGIDKQLQRGGRVADIGCGHGASTLIMAAHFPNSSFYGFDYHEESIAIARKRATEAGLSNAFFEVALAENFPGKKYDLICYMDAFHDFGNPLKAIRHSRNALADNGSVMLVEPASFDNPEKNFNPVGRMFYAASTALCVPHSHSQQGGYCLGAQAGPGQVQELAAEAGYSRFRIARRTPVNLIFEIKK